MPPTVAACQLAVADLAVDTNLERILNRVEELPDRVDVACFPEYALTGFVPDGRVHEVALDLEGPVIEQLRATAERAATDLLVGCLEHAPESDRPYNTAVYLDADGDTTVYRKRHRWGSETELLARGTALPVFETPCGTTAMLTCYDLNFVEESATLTERGVETLLVPGAWPAAHADNWRLLIRARALDGVRWTVGIGRTGTRECVAAPSATYAGQSLVARPDGSIEAELGRSPGTLLVDVDPEVTETARQEIGIDIG